jgi:hypothetical protein
MATTDVAVRIGVLGILLATGLTNSPAQAFGAAHVIALTALRAAGFRVQTAAVIFAGQLWIQARRCVPHLSGRRAGAHGACHHGSNANPAVVDVLQPHQYRFGMAIYPCATMLFRAMSG